MWDFIEGISGNSTTSANPAPSKDDGLFRLCEILRQYCDSLANWCSGADKRMVDMKIEIEILKKKLEDK